MGERGISISLPYFGCYLLESEFSLQPTQTVTFVPARDSDLLSNFQSVMSQTYRRCSIPCWWGLQPGETTLEQVASFIADNGFEREWLSSPYQMSLQEYLRLGEAILLDFVPSRYEPNGEVVIYFTFDENDILQVLSVRFNDPNRWMRSFDSIELAQLLKKETKIPEVYAAPDSPLGNYVIVLVYRDSNTQIRYTFDLSNVNQIHTDSFQLCLDIARTTHILVGLNYASSELVSSSSTGYEPIEQAFPNLPSDQEFVEFFRQNPTDCLIIPREH